MMAFKRRQLLRRLLFVFGVSCVVTRERAAIAAVAASATPVKGTDSKPGTAATTEMEKVTGIGGFFFRAKDPKGLGRWYQQHLGSKDTKATKTKQSRLSFDHGLS
jgi:hypothetical protein